MCNKLLRRQRGFSLILVLFLLVVVSLLAVAMARLNSGGSTAVSQEILSVRALFAAESGAQAMAMKTFPLGAATPACPGNFSITFTATGLTGCTADTTCAVSLNTVGPLVFSITSHGICTAGNQTARRKVQVGLRTL